jgi:hypothetical protein
LDSCLAEHRELLRQYALANRDQIRRVGVTVSWMRSWEMRSWAW